MHTILRTTFVLALLGGMSGCVTRSVVIEPHVEPQPVAPDEPADPHYEPVAGRTAGIIAALRAEPAPVRPQLVEGTRVLADRQAQGAQGYAHVGDSRYAADDATAVDKAMATATKIGADRMLVYRAQKIGDSAERGFLAAYYVRFKLLFGATFRNLTSAERDALGGVSGVRIGSVIDATPASQANLIAGDFVLAVNGKPVVDRAGFQESLKNAAGTAVTLNLRRNDVSMERVVRLGAMPPTADP
ncbi:MAG: PDZ domain-containing protein [Xanthomonadales bacterium]|nr:PDZ domain-containing protein [Xanthomonadales bacterium]